MKKLLFAMALIGVLIGSTLGGIALADKPDAVPPLTTLDAIDQNVSDIQAELTNMPRIEITSGLATILPGTYQTFEYPQLRHVSVTIGGEFDDEGTMLILVITPAGKVKVAEGLVGAFKGFSYELDADMWQIYSPVINPSMDVGWTVTTTYSP